MKNLFKSSALVVLIVFTITLVIGLIDSIKPTGVSSAAVAMSWVIAFAAALVAIFVVIVWAIPVHLVLSKMGHSNIAWYILAAVIPSFVFIFVVKPFGLDPFSALLTQALICSFIGSVGAAAFWYLSVYRQTPVT